MLVTHALLDQGELLVGRHLQKRVAGRCATEKREDSHSIVLVAVHIGAGVFGRAFGIPLADACAAPTAGPFVDPTRRVTLGSDKMRVRSIDGPRGCTIMRFACLVCSLSSGGLYSAAGITSDPTRLLQILNSITVIDVGERSRLSVVAQAGC